MTNWTGNWERTLLDRAQEALEGWEPANRVEPFPPELAAAYQACADITSQHSRTFYLASGLLPPAKRWGARALYAFCRTSDEAVDSSPSGSTAALDAWRGRVLSAEPARDPILRAWADTRARFHIPQPYVKQLLDGVGVDLVQARYDTFADLAQYCYGVACTVGLMSMHIVGFHSLDAVAYAIKLGVALQLTNILRDVGEDWSAGRLYLPREDMAAFGVTEDDIAQGHIQGHIQDRVNERWRALIEFQIMRARQFYDQAWPGVALLDRDGRFAIATASHLYQGILDDIIAHRCDVFTRRAHLTAMGKARRLPLIWWRARRLATLQVPANAVDGMARPAGNWM